MRSVSLKSLHFKKCHLTSQTIYQVLLWPFCPLWLDGKWSSDMTIFKNIFTQLLTHIIVYICTCMSCTRVIVTNNYLFILANISQVPAKLKSWLHHCWL